MQIHSPAEGYTATDVYGTTSLHFENGVAEFDGDLPAGVRQYLLGAGYGLDEEPAEPESTPEPADPRTLPDGQIGTALRDAAVDPRPEDFLAPTNAGEANPHGPDVVSPEIHASQGIRPVKGGDVHVDDPDAQDAAEKEHVAAVQTGEAPAAPPEFPEGDPVESWKNDQILAWAKANSVDLGDATKKADMLAAIEASRQTGTDSGATPPQS